MTSTGRVHVGMHLPRRPRASTAPHDFNSPVALNTGVEVGVGGHVGDQTRQRRPHHRAGEHVSGAAIIADVGGDASSASERWALRGEGGLWTSSALSTTGDSAVWWYRAFGDRRMPGLNS
jgi:hypothetical protein